MYWVRAQLGSRFGFIAAMSSTVCAALFVYAVYLPYHITEDTSRGEMIDTNSSSDSGPSSLSTTSIVSLNGHDRSSPIPEHEEVEPNAVTSTSSHDVLATRELLFAPTDVSGGNGTTGKKFQYTDLSRIKKSSSPSSSHTLNNDDERSLQTVDISSTTGSSSQMHFSHHKQRRQASPLKTKLLIPTVERMVGKHSPILIHVLISC